MAFDVDKYLAGISNDSGTSEKFDPDKYLYGGSVAQPTGDTTITAESQYKPTATVVVDEPAEVRPVGKNISISPTALGRQMAAGTARLLGSHLQTAATDLSIPAIGAGDESELDQGQLSLYRRGKAIAESGEKPKDSAEQIALQYYKGRQLAKKVTERGQEFAQYLQKVADNLAYDVGSEEDKANLQDAVDWLAEDNPELKSVKNLGKTIKAGIVLAANNLPQMLEYAAAHAIGGQMGAYAVTANAETGNWQMQARELGIDDPEILKKYSALYGITSGAVEQLLTEVALAPVKALIKGKPFGAVKKLLGKKLAKNALAVAAAEIGRVLGTSAGESVEEVTQEELQYWLTAAAMKEMADKHPERAQEFSQRAAEFLKDKPDISQIALRAFVPGLVYAGVPSLVSGGASLIMRGRGKNVAVEEDEDVLSSIPRATPKKKKTGQQTEQQQTTQQQTGQQNAQQTTQQGQQQQTGQQTGAQGQQTAQQQTAQQQTAQQQTGQQTGAQEQQTAQQQTTQQQTAQQQTGQQTGTQEQQTAQQQTAEQQTTQTQEGEQKAEDEEKQETEQTTATESQEKQETSETQQPEQEPQAKQAKPPMQKPVRGIEPLYGILNRAAFDEDLRAAVKSGKQVAVAIIDTVNQKRLNDELGHEGADSVLREIGAIEDKHVKELAKKYPGATRYRTGGDERAIIAPGATAQELSEAMAAMQKEIDDYVDSRTIKTEDGREVRLGKLTHARHLRLPTGAGRIVYGVSDTTQLSGDVSDKATELMRIADKNNAEQSYQRSRDAAMRAAQETGTYFVFNKKDGRFEVLPSIVGNLIGEHEAEWNDLSVNEATERAIDIIRKDVNYEIIAPEGQPSRRSTAEQRRVRGGQADRYADKESREAEPESRIESDVDDFRQRPGESAEDYVMRLIYKLLTREQKRKLSDALYAEEQQYRAEEEGYTEPDWVKSAKSETEWTKEEARKKALNIAEELRDLIYRETGWDKKKTAQIWKWWLRGESIPDNIRSKMAQRIHEMNEVADDNNTTLVPPDLTDGEHASIDDVWQFVVDNYSPAELGLEFRKKALERGRETLRVLRERQRNKKLRAEELKKGMRETPPARRGGVAGGRSNQATVPEGKGIAKGGGRIRGGRQREQIEGKEGSKQAQMPEDEDLPFQARARGEEQEYSTETAREDIESAAVEPTAAERVAFGYLARAIAKTFDIDGVTTENIVKVEMPQSEEMAAIESALSEINYRILPIRLTGKASLRSTFNAAVVQGLKNTIVWNVDGRQDAPVIVTALHELAEANPTLMSNFLRVCREELSEEGIKYGEKVLPKNADIARELAFDWLGYEAQKPSFWENVYKRAPTVVQEVIARLVSILNRLLGNIQNKGDVWFRDVARVRDAAEEAMTRIIAESKLVVSGEDKDADNIIKVAFEDRAEYQSSTQKRTPMPKIRTFDEYLKMAKGKKSLAESIQADERMRFAAWAESQPLPAVMYSGTIENPQEVYLITNRTPRDALEHPEYMYRTTRFVFEDNVPVPTGHTLYKTKTAAFLDHKDLNYDTEARIYFQTREQSGSKETEPAAEGEEKAESTKQEGKSQETATEKAQEPAKTDSGNILKALDVVDSEGNTPHTVEEISKLLDDMYLEAVSRESEEGERGAIAIPRKTKGEAVPEAAKRAEEVLSAGRLGEGGVIRDITESFGRAANTIKEAFLKYKSKAEPMKQFIDDMRTGFLPMRRRIIDTVARWKYAVLADVYKESGENGVRRVTDMLMDADLLQRLSEGQEVAGGLTEDDVRQHLNWVRSLATPAEMKAVEMIRKILDSLGADLVARGKISATRKNYFPHYVIDYTPDWMRGLHFPMNRRAKEPYRGYTKHALGSKRLIATDDDVIWTHIAKVLIDNAQSDWCLKQLQKYDKKAEWTKLNQDKKLRPNMTVTIDGNKYIAYEWKRNYYRVATISDAAIEKLAKKLHDDIGQGIIDAILSGEDKEAKERLLNVGSALAVGSSQLYLVPAPVALAMSDLTEKVGQAWDVLFMFSRATSAWKSMTLSLAGLPYQLGNIFGDFVNLTLFDPGAYKYVDTAARIASKIFYQKTEWARLIKLDEFERYVMRVALDKDVVFSGFTNELRRYTGLTKIGGAWQTLNEFRESLARLAILAHQLDRHRKGKKIQAVANIDIEGLDAESAAGKIAREALVDYLAVPRTYKLFLSGMIAPFVRFHEANLRNHLRAVFGGREQIVKYLLPVASAYLFAWAWNNGDEERRKRELALPDYVRNRLHIIIGADKDGNIVVWAPQQPVDMAWSWLGLNQLGRIASDLRAGEITEKEAARQLLSAVGNGWRENAQALLNPMIQFIQGLSANRDPFTGRKIMPEEIYDIFKEDWTYSYAWEYVVGYFAEKLITPIAQYSRVLSGTEPITNPVYDWLISCPLNVIRALGIYKFDRETGEISREYKEIRDDRAVVAYWKSQAQKAIERRGISEETKEYIKKRMEEAGLRDVEETIDKWFDSPDAKRADVIYRLHNTTDPEKREELLKEKNKLALERLERIRQTLPNIVDPKRFHEIASYGPEGWREKIAFLRWYLSLPQEEQKRFVQEVQSENKIRGYSVESEIRKMFDYFSDRGFKERLSAAKKAYMNNSISKEEFDRRVAEYRKQAKAFAEMMNSVNNEEGVR